jgi:hypothetical protein
LIVIASAALFLVIKKDFEKTQKHLLKMMEGDLKLAQALARISTNNSRSNSPARTGSPNPGADGGGTATDDAMKTHASMVLEKIQGFR